MTGTIPVTTPPPPERPDFRRKRRRRPIWRFFLALFLLALIGGFAFLYFRFGLNPLQAMKGAVGIGRIITQRNAPPFDGRERVNILVLGVDVSFDNAGAARTDTIKFVSIDLKKPSISVLSIPRDTWVEIPGHHAGRINGAYQLGGHGLAERFALAKATVSGLLSELTGEEVPIDHYVRIQTDSFVKIIDAIGGVHVDVEKRMKYDDPSQDLHIDLHPGPQFLDGYNAMCYARFRMDWEGDYGRIRRQDQLMQALVEEVKTPEAQQKLARKMGLLMSLIRTDIPEEDLLAVKRIVDQVGMAGIHAATLPTVPTKKGRADVVEIEDFEMARQTVSEVLHGARPTVVVLNGSGMTGLAGEVREQVDPTAYNVLAVGTTLEPAPASVVLATPGSAKAARMLAASLGIAEVDTEHAAPDADFGKDVTAPPAAEITVLLGGDYSQAMSARAETTEE
ncbi:MAG: Regulatory protein MsrR [bacterium ADurb.Bin429]|nr:MAG: Regulatory protein MsrR [bacterium ADurb.Bin429]